MKLSNNRIIIKMDKSESQSVRDASSVFQRLLNDRKFQEFWAEFLTRSSVRFMPLMAIKSIGVVIRSNLTVSYSDASVLTKLAGRILSSSPTRSLSPMRFLMPELETLLMSWIPEKMDDVCLFIQTLLVDKTLAIFGTDLITNIFKVKYPSLLF